MNRYRNLLPLLINGEHGQGDEFELELSAADEQTNLDSGLLEIVPREWRNVTAETKVFGAGPGETFTAALTLGQQQHLVDGGFIELVEQEPEPAAAAPTKARTRKRKG